MPHSFSKDGHSKRYYTPRLEGFEERQLLNGASLLAAMPLHGDLTRSGVVRDHPGVPAATPELSAQPGMVLSGVSHDSGNPFKVGAAETIAFPHQLLWASSEPRRDAVIEGTGDPDEDFWHGHPADGDRAADLGDETGGQTRLEKTAAVARTDLGEMDGDLVHSIEGDGDGLGMATGRFRNDDQSISSRSEFRLTFETDSRGDRSPAQGLVWKGHGSGEVDTGTPSSSGRVGIVLPGVGDDSDASEAGEAELAQDAVFAQASGLLASFVPFDPAFVGKAARRLLDDLDSAEAELGSALCGSREKLTWVLAAAAALATCEAARRQYQSLPQNRLVTGSAQQLRPPPDGVGAGAES